MKPEQTAADGPRTPAMHREVLADLLRGAGAGPGEEGVDLGEAPGRVLARTVPAPHDSPRFDNSQMDGYAVTLTDLQAQETQVSGQTDPAARLALRAGPVLPAGTPASAVYPRGLAPGIAAPVMTGAQLPEGTGAVVPVERCDPPDFLEAGAVLRVPWVRPGTFLRRTGSDLRRGACLLPAGTVLTPQAVALAASQGLDRLPVVSAPRVLVCTGGDEIAAPAEAATDPGVGSATVGLPEAVVPDANGPLLAALLRRAGALPVGQVRTSDHPETLRRALDRAVQEHRPDLVITSGGISHGRYEVVRQVLSETGGAWFGHVAQQPGGPQGHGRWRGVPVICLPGNPVSTFVSFRVLVEPVLAEVYGAAPAPQILRARLIVPVAGVAGKTQYRRAILSLGAAEEELRLVVEPVGGAGSHLLAQALPANALMAVPPGASLDPGALVEVLPLSETGLPVTGV